MRARLTSVAVLACFLLLVVLSFRQISGADYWWQWATGKLVLEQGVPRTDSFSYTRQGEDWIELRWLFCAVLYGVVRTFGHSAAQAMQAAAMVGAFLVARYTAGNARNGVALVGLLLAVVASGQRMFVRPEMVSFLFCAVFLWLVIHHRRTGTRWLWVLPVLQMVWVNAHTQFVLGVVICGTGLIASLVERFVMRRTAGPRPLSLAGVTTLCAVATLANPYGWRGAVFPFQLFEQLRGTRFKEQIGEFASPFALDLSPTSAAFVLLLGLVGMAIWRRARNLDLAALLWTLATAYLACLAVRNIPLFALAAVALLRADDGEESATRWSEGSAAGLSTQPSTATPLLSALVTVVAVGFGALCATNLLSRVFDDGTRYGLGLLPNRYPIGAAQFLQNPQIKGRIINSMTEGSFLIATGHQVFIDPRLEVYGEKFFEEYLRVSSDRRAFAEARQRWNFDIAVVDPAAKLVERLLEDGSFRLVYFSPSAAIFLGRDQATGVPALDERSSIEAASKIPVDLIPRDAEKLASFLISTGYPMAAVTLIDRVAARSVRLEWMLSAGLMRAGLFDRALEVLQKLEKTDPGNPELAPRLAAALIETGRTQEGLSVLDRALTKDSRNAALWAYKAKALVALRQIPQAVQSMQRAVELEPSNPHYRKALEELNRALR
jgi:hypothetical protein